MKIKRAHSTVLFNSNTIRFFLCLLLFAMVFPLIGCSTLDEALTEIKISGIENFHTESSSMEVTKYLLPDDDFMRSFEYSDANYQYYEKWPFSSQSRELALVELIYTQETYMQAKQYCLNNMDLSETNIKELNGYVFLENLELAKQKNYLQNGVNTKFPHHFTMFVYNDTKQTLLFMGFYCCADMHEKANLATEEWDVFLNFFYNDFYCFAE